MIKEKFNSLLSSYTAIPQRIIKDEIEGLYGEHVLKEMGEIIKYYDVYENGAHFTAEGAQGGYVPADLRIKQTAALIDKEARFAFSKSPDIWITPADNIKSKRELEKAKEQTTILQAYVDKVLQKTRFFSNLLKAAKDCFIGKRVACFVNFHEDTQKIQISFVPSLEFVYETDETDIDRLTKIICFYTRYDSDNKTSQRIYKKKYWLQNEKCWIEEGIYDGMGKLVEEIQPARATKFDYIPAVVIRNDGLTGDLDGVSEVEKLKDYEAWVSRLTSADIDSERQSMNPIRYTVNMSPESTKGLTTSAGSFWDLTSDENVESGYQVGTLETTMGYSSSLSATLNRIKSSAYTELDMPDTSPDALQGVITSGKTLKALYWGLIVRCDEKMQEWRPAIEKVVHTLIDGAKLYPMSATSYTNARIPDIDYNVKVDNQYSLPEDEQEEKSIDLQEVSAQTMSRKSYMKKWRNLTDDEAEAELRQMALERDILEDTYDVPTDTSDFGSENESPENIQSQNNDDNGNEVESETENIEKSEPLGKEVMTNEEN